MKHTNQINYLNQWIQTNKVSLPDSEFALPLITCSDGTELCIKLDENSFCSPKRKIKDMEGYDYTKVEIRFVRSFGKFIRPETLSDFEIGSIGRYANVPVEVVDFYINQHGGYIDYSVD